MDKSVYVRANKARTMTVNKRKGAPSRALTELPPVIAIGRASQCHVTPERAAHTMVEALEATRDQLVLEPQAGTGNLIQALIDVDHSPFELTMVERSHQLCAVLRKRFKSTSIPDPVNECFLKYTQEAASTIEFSRILMNPPFRNSKKHLSAALELLGHAGHDSAILVALVPITFEHDEAELIETLPNDTFSTAAVNTKIIRIVR